MQCNVEPVEEGAKYHVSFLTVPVFDLLDPVSQRRISLLPTKLTFLLLSLSLLLANITAETGG